MERLLTYVRNGVVDPDLTVETPDYCPDGIRAAVGDDPYRTPILDSPPWYDITDGDSGDFAGFLITGVTGVWGSTKTTQVTERAADGGIIGATRAASKPLGFTAIGIARTQCGIDAGIAWLSSALHPPCADPTALGNGGALEFFTCCPDSTCPIPDPLADTTDVDSTIELTVRYPYTPPTAGSVDYLVGGPAGSGSGYVAGGDAGGETDVYVGGGALLPGAEPDPFGHENEEGFYAGQVTDCGTEQVAWDLTIATPGGGIDPCRVAFAAVSPAGEFLWVEPWQDLTPGAHVLTWTPVEVFDSWRPALLAQPFASVTVNSLTATERPLLTVDACVAPLRRSFQQVVTIDGPHVTTQWGTDGEVTLVQVEWTWTAADPYAYADPIPLLTGVPSDSESGVPTYTHPGVNLVADTTFVTAVDTACPLPTAGAATCADDPDCTGRGTPPLAPVFSTLCYIPPTDYARRAFTIDPDVTPASSAALSFTFTNPLGLGSDIRGYRVRVYNDPDPDVGVADECAFTDEFTIDYLPAGQTLTVDSAAGTVTLTCSDGTTTDGMSVLSGAYGGPFTFPTIGCGNRIFVVVDSPESVDNLLLFDVTMTRREG